MNLDTGNPARDLAHQPADQLQVMLPEPVREMMKPNRVQARVCKHHLDRSARGGVMVEDRLHIFPDAADNTHGKFLCWPPARTQTFAGDTWLIAVAFDRGRAPLSFCAAGLDRGFT